MAESSREPMAVLVTAPQSAAQEIAETLVRHKLAACVNIVAAMESIFWWEDEIQREQESLLIAKTTSDLVEPMTELLGVVHPYDNFELIALPVVAGSSRYLDWVLGSTGPGTPG